MLNEDLELVRRELDRLNEARLVHEFNAEEQARYDELTAKERILLGRGPRT